MNQKGKRYTEEEFDQIRQLYAKGYSASLILDKINRPARNVGNAGNWLFNMQKRLNLPKRGLGFRGVRKGLSPVFELAHLKLKVKRLKERRTKLPKILRDVEDHKLKLQKELQEIDKAVLALEKQVVKVRRSVRNAEPR